MSSRTVEALSEANGERSQNVLQCGAMRFLTSPGGSFEMTMRTVKDLKNDALSALFWKNLTFLCSTKSAVISNECERSQRAPQCESTRFLASPVGSFEMIMRTVEDLKNDALSLSTPSMRTFFSGVLL